MSSLGGRAKLQQIVQGAGVINKMAFCFTGCQGNTDVSPIHLVCRSESLSLVSSLKAVNNRCPTNKPVWPRLWLIRILSVEVDPLHLDQGQEITAHSLCHANEAHCFPITPFRVKYISLWANKQADSVSTKCPL